MVENETRTPGMKNVACQMATMTVMTMALLVVAAVVFMQLMTTMNIMLYMVGMDNMVTVVEEVESASMKQMAQNVIPAGVQGFMVTFGLEDKRGGAIQTRSSLVKFMREAVRGVQETTTCGSGRLIMLFDAAFKL